MSRNDRGEPSRRRDEDERPFKKAKYVWQLKGKHHLRHHPKESSESETVSESTNQPNETKSKPVEEPKNCSRCLNTLIAHSRKFLDSEEEPKPPEEAVPVSMVRPRRENHDDFLQKWQARQVAKSFIENTVNTILERAKLAPAEASDFSSDNCDNEQVEDEGIMMAIQSHGLQSNARPSYSEASGSASEARNYEVLEENYRNKCFEHSEGASGSASGKVPGEERANDADFLRTAVTMAIQNKGLSSYSYR